MVHHKEVRGSQIPKVIMDRMRDAQEIGAERARQEGVAIAQQILGVIKDTGEGIQISPPLGKYELALEVLKVLLIHGNYQV